MPRPSTQIDFSKITSYPWEKHAKELVSAYKWFVKFRNIPYDHDQQRTIIALFDLYPEETSKLGKDRDAGYAKLRKWSAKYRWPWRAKAYDKFQSREEVIADLRRRQRSREEWNRRQDEFSEDTWKDIQALRKIARQIIEMPLFEDEITHETVEKKNGKQIIHQTIVRKPIGAKLSDATQIIEKTDKLGRLLFNLSTENIDFTVPQPTLIALARERFKQSIEEFPEINIEFRAYAISTRYNVEVSEILDPSVYDEKEEIVKQLNQLKPKALKLGDVDYEKEKKKQTPRPKKKKT